MKHKEVAANVRIVAVADARRCYSSIPEMAHVPVQAEGGEGTMIDRAAWPAAGQDKRCDNEDARPIPHGSAVVVLARRLDLDVTREPHVDEAQIYELAE